MTDACTQPTKGRKARPFLKWAGGKSQLLAQFSAHYPEELGKGEICRYVEPFLGGGAVFLDVVQRFTVAQSVLFDINRELILAYRVVQQAAQGLVESLGELHKHYYSLDDNRRERYYYQIRDEYNSQCGEINYERFSDRWIARTAFMIFLNKTCYNGLFRVNSRGLFNVPFGRYRRPAILDAQNIFLVSALLQRAELVVGNFQASEPHIDEQTFVYFDPPYRPVSATSSFTSYSSHRFGDTEQAALAQFFAEMDRSRRAKLMLSNSDPTHLQPDDDFFETRYAGYRFHRVYASRMINAHARKRGKIPELLITNY